MFLFLLDYIIKQAALINYLAITIAKHDLKIQEVEMEIMEIIEIKKILYKTD
jgi:hypothetical protein